MNYRTVFQIHIQLSTRRAVSVADVSPSEAVQKFLREIAAFKLTGDQIDTITAEFKEVKF